MAYYKIDVKSPTGKKLTDIFDRAKEVDARHVAFLTKVGAESGIRSNKSLAGLTAVKLTGEVDRKEWKLYGAARDHLYSPQVKSSLRAEYEAIGSVRREEIDKAVGNNNWVVSHCGYAWSKDKKWHLIDINLKPKFVFNPIELTEDCVEILSSEYEALFPDEKK